MSNGTHVQSDSIGGNLHSTTTIPINKCATLGVGMKVAVCYVWVDAKDENVMVCATTLRRNF